MRPTRHIACIALSHPHKKKKFAPSVTGDINPQSSHWYNGKMKIACNSAYIHTKTLNFTFAVIMFQLLRNRYGEHSIFSAYNQDTTLLYKHFTPARTWICTDQSPANCTNRNPKH